MLVKHTSSVSGIFSLSFHILVYFVDNEDNTAQKFRAIDLPMDMKTVTSKLAFQKISYGTYEFNSRNNYRQTYDPNTKSEPNTGKTLNLVIDLTILFAILFGQNREDEERKRSSHF